MANNIRVFNLIGNEYQIYQRKEEDKDGYKEPMGIITLTKKQLLKLHKDITEILQERRVYSAEVLHCKECPAFSYIDRMLSDKGFCEKLRKEVPDKHTILPDCPL